MDMKQAEVKPQLKLAKAADPSQPAKPLSPASGRTRLLLTLAESSDADNVMRALQRYGYNLNSRDANGLTAMHYAGIAANSKAVGLFHKLGVDIGQAIAGAIIGGQKAFLQQLMCRYPGAGKSYMAWGAGYAGDLDLIKAWELTKTAEDAKHTMAGCASGGHFDLLMQLLIESERQQDTIPTVVQHAAATQQLDILNTLQQQFSAENLVDAVLIGAALGGHRGLFNQYMKRVQHTNKVCLYAGMGGHAAILDAVFEQFDAHRAEIIMGLAVGGNFERLEEIASCDATCLPTLCQRLLALSDGLLLGQVLARFPHIAPEPYYQQALELQRFSAASALLTMLPTLNPQPLIERAINYRNTQILTKLIQQKQILQPGALKQSLQRGVLNAFVAADKMTELCEHLRSPQDLLPLIISTPDLYLKAGIPVLEFCLAQELPLADKLSLQPILQAITKAKCTSTNAVIRDAVALVTEQFRSDTGKQAVSAAVAFCGTHYRLLDSLIQSKSPLIKPGHRARVSRFIEDNKEPVEARWHANGTTQPYCSEALVAFAERSAEEAEAKPTAAPMSHKPSQGIGR